MTVHDGSPEPDDEGQDDPGVGLTAPARRWEFLGHPLDILGAIAAGGVIGAEARYGIGLALPHAPSGWPLATLLINFSGCLLIGVLMAMITEVVQPHRLLRPFIGVGILGGYTTFSTYTVDGLTLTVHGAPGLAAAYLVVTPVGSVLACAVGMGATRLAARHAGRGEVGR